MPSLDGAAGTGYFANGLSTEAFAAALPVSGCNIKGNISIESGEPIYHCLARTIIRILSSGLNSASAGSVRRRKHAKLDGGDRNDEYPFEQR